MYTYYTYTYVDFPFVEDFKNKAIILELFENWKLSEFRIERRIGDWFSPRFLCWCNDCG